MVDKRTIESEIKNLNAAKLLIDDAIKQKQSNMQNLGKDHWEYSPNAKTINDDLKVARRLILKSYESSSRYY